MIPIHCNLKNQFWMFCFLRSNTRSTVLPWRRILQSCKSFSSGTRTAKEKRWLRTRPEDWSVSCFCFDPQKHLPRFFLLFSYSSFLRLINWERQTDTVRAQQKKKRKMNRMRCWVAISFTIYSICIQLSMLFAIV